MDLWDLRDELIFRELRLTLGRHPQTGQPYLLFMVQLGFGEYPARLRVSEDAFRQYRQDPHLAARLTERYQGLTHEQVREAGGEC
ncbi:hypothetical protein DAETH_24090 [Deinococcus aetherius]|uniref:DUF4158 domain-containing protein n=1 Tax=Deinococcus aetherius TaxID=200252 RepID=A0ABM8AFK6_9DEIO|nr:hypothetical protein [Deinococcus aetherius]BDP42440.1 hypothetical protein DAETH_24090 [Deinococcus aetherius]